METGHHHHLSQDDTKQSAWHHSDSHTALRSSQDVTGDVHKYSRERLEVGDGSDLFSRPFPYSSSSASPERTRVFPECEVTNHPRYIEVKPLESGPERPHYDHSIVFPSTSSSPDKRQSTYQRHSPELQTSHQEENSVDNCQTSQVSYKNPVPFPCSNKLKAILA